MAIYVVLNFSGNTPDVNVSSAPNYRVGNAKVDNTQKIVAADFDASHIGTLIAASKTLLTQAQAASQSATWDAAKPQDPVFA